MNTECFSRHSPFHACLLREGSGDACNFAELMAKLCAVQYVEVWPVVTLIRTRWTLPRTSFLCVHMCPLHKGTRNRAITPSAAKDSQQD